MKKIIDEADAVIISDHILRNGSQFREPEVTGLKIFLCILRLGLWG
jgi:hypothetical protein